MQRSQIRTMTVSEAIAFPDVLCLTSAKVTQQLNDGVRLLQMQAHDNSGDIYLCHTLCVSTRTVCCAEPPETLTRGYPTEELCSTTLTKVRSHLWFLIDSHSERARS